MNKDKTIIYMLDVEAKTCSQIAYINFEKFWTFLFSDKTVSEN